MAKDDNPLVAALEKLLMSEMKKLTDKPKSSDTPISLTDKMKIVDRALKLAAVKAKMTNDGFGSGFHDDDDE